MRKREEGGKNGGGGSGRTEEEESETVEWRAGVETIGRQSANARLGKMMC